MLPWPLTVRWCRFSLMICNCGRKNKKKLDDFHFILLHHQNGKNKEKELKFYHKIGWIMLSLKWERISHLVTASHAKWYPQFYKSVSFFSLFVIVFFFFLWKSNALALARHIFQFESLLHFLTNEKRCGFSNLQSRCDFNLNTIWNRRREGVK